MNTSTPQKSLFRRESETSIKDTEDPPRFQVDARLPNPAIITCNEPLPLRILVQRLNASTDTVSLQVLQIELIGYTNVRAHDLTRTESGTWVLTSQSNMNIPIGNSGDPSNKEWKIPARFWDNIRLPNTVAPSFDTCNISRSYELDIRVGMSRGSPGAVKVCRSPASTKSRLVIFVHQVLTQPFPVEFLTVCSQN